MNGIGPIYIFYYNIYVFSRGSFEKWKLMAGVQSHDQLSKYGPASKSSLGLGK